MGLPATAAQRLWLLSVVATAQLLPSRVAAPAHPGLVRMAGAGRGLLLGVPPTLRMKYPAVANPCGNFTCHPGNFTCLDGQQVVPAKKINDEQCDCDDGSDEPSTSACPEGRFFCANSAHKPQWLNSSSVGDGFCDCCDGTDEHARGGCPNACAMLASYERHVMRAASAPVLSAASFAARRAQREANERGQSSMHAELEHLLALQARADDKYREWTLKYGDEPEPTGHAAQLALTPADDPPNEVPDPGELVDEEHEFSLPRVVAIKGRPFARGDDLKFNEGDVIVVERKDDLIWWFGYVDSDESEGPRTHGRFASNLVVALRDDARDASREHALKEARVDAKAQAAQAVAELEQQLPKRLNQDQAIAQAKERAEARANGELPQIAALSPVKMDDTQFHRTAKVAYVALRRERAQRALQIARLRQRLNSDVPVDWLHLHGHCLTLRAGEQGQFKVCLFEKVERFTVAGAHGASHGTDTNTNSDDKRSTVQLIGKWNRTTWQLQSWPGQPQADADVSLDQSAPPAGDGIATGVVGPILMQFDGGAACSEQPGMNFSATVEMRCDVVSRTKRNPSAGIAAYDELQSVHRLPRKPCHYIFALASPDACKTQHSASGSVAEDSIELPAAMPLAPLDEDEAFVPRRVQMDPQEKRPARDPTKVATERRAAEHRHRASMEEARKQRLLDLQMQRQLEQLQKQREERLREKGAASRDLENQAQSQPAAAALNLETSTDNGNTQEEGVHHVPQLSHGKLSGFGSPPSTPEGVTPHDTDDREL